MRLCNQKKGIRKPPKCRRSCAVGIGCCPPHCCPFRCEAVKFQTPKAVSVTLKEDYSIPERCLGMREMLKKFKGEGTASSSWCRWS